MDRKRAQISVAREFSSVEGPLPARVECEAHPGWCKTWVARLSAPVTDADRQFGVHREFVDRDGQSLSRAGNGSVYYTVAAPGLYEASSVYRSYRGWRVIFRVHDDGTAEWIADDQQDNLRAVYPTLFAEEASHAVA